MGVREDDIKSFIDNNYGEIIRRFVKIEGKFFSKPEYPLVNGQQIDRAIINEGRKIAALIECKGSGGVNALVDGIGQATQCAYHIRENINGEFMEGCRAFLAVPKEMLEGVNLELFSFPDIGILLVDLKTNTVEQYKKKAYFSGEVGQWVTINPYYFRDSSLEGIYFYLHMMLKNLGLPRDKRLSLLQMENRSITVREAAAIMGFPNSYRFFGSHSKRCEMAGQAVAVGMASAIAESVSRFLKVAASQTH